MFIDRIFASVPGWLAMPLSVLSTLSALAGAGCLFAAAVFGAFAWGYSGLGAFVLAGILWQISDRVGLGG